MEIVVLASATAVVSWILAMMEVFRDGREWVGKWAKNKPTSKARQKLAYLVTCPFCLSAYVSAFFLALSPIKIGAEHFGGYIVAWFYIQAIVYPLLTIYNWMRCCLRWTKAKADVQEELLKQIKIGTRKQKREEDRPVILPFPSITEAVSPQPETV
jgi:uncharacterized membrane protein